LIELTNCSLILDDHTVLDEVNFALRHGERWAVVGPNGSGKTLLLKMLRSDIWPTPTGRERRDYHLDERDSAGTKELIAYVGPERQDKYVRYDWNLTVTQVVTTGLFDEDIPLTRPTRVQRDKVDRVLRRFSLWGLRGRHILTLSYGQRRLALVARAFASKARVLLLDEVFNGLDARAKEKLKLALEQPRGGHDWVITSHRPAELPKNVTHVARIAAGKIVEVRRAAVPRHARGPHPNPPPRGAGEGVRKHPLILPPLPLAGEGAREHPLRLAPPPLAGEGREGAKEHPLRLAPPPLAGEGREGVSLVEITNTTIYRDYRPIIRDLNWTLNRGEHWAVLGANGAGKSTLLSLIYGDLHPALGGTIARAGVPFGTRIEEWKHRVGWVAPELQADYYAATSIEEIVVSGRYSSVGLNQPMTRADRTAAARWLKFFGIAALRDRKPRQVSYGQMRLALIARAMVNNPELLLLDEPCTGLDGDVRSHVLAMLQRLAESGTQLVMAVHDTSDIVPAVQKVLKIGKGGKTTAAIQAIADLTAGLRL
jgi:molybdate transport system ATP-binding protein